MIPLYVALTVGVVTLTAGAVCLILRHRARRRLPRRPGYVTIHAGDAAKGFMVKDAVVDIGGAPHRITATSDDGTGLTVERL